eukprot:5845373-Pleurochrysis_carterae.AAC.5
MNRPHPHDGKHKMGSIWVPDSPVVLPNRMMYMSNQSAANGVLPCRETPFQTVVGKPYVNNNASIGRPNLGYARDHPKGGVAYNSLHPVSAPILKPVDNHNKALLSRLY